MALFKKKRASLAKDAEREREELRRQREELHSKILGDSHDDAYYDDRSKEANIDNVYEDMRGIDEIKDIIESTSKHQDTPLPFNNLPITQYVCSGCGAVFGDPWDRCMRCGGIVEKKQIDASSRSTSSGKPPESSGLGLDLGRFSEPSSPRAGLSEKKREMKSDPGRLGRVSGSVDSSRSEQDIFSKEVLEGSLYQQNIPTSSPAPASPFPSPKTREKPGAQVPAVKKVKKVRKVRKVKKPVSLQAGAPKRTPEPARRSPSAQACPHCGKTLTKAPPGGWKFCVFCGEKI